MTFNNIQAGELGNNGNNTQVLKELYEIKPAIESLDCMISGLDTSIRSPRFK